MDIDPGKVVSEFVAAFAAKDIDRLALFLHPDVEFEAYGLTRATGREQTLAVWATTFATFATVKFATVHQAVNGDVVLEEQVHGLGLPGRPVALIKNVAVYRVRDGLITEWRDYTDATHAQSLL